MIQNNYIEKTYAGWLGKIIGIRLGSPIEGWTYEQIKKVYGEIRDYLVDYRDYAADDDSNGPLFFIRALVDYSHKIEEITEKEMGHTWLNYAPEGHGFFWWGGYGISTEHTAYENMKNGIDAPRSGSIEQNGLTVAQQIGGQIFIDSWGFVTPGQPELAAEYARKMARVSHDGEAVYGGQFVAACVSAAYTASDIREVIEAGLGVIPRECEYARVVQAVREFYENDMEENWENCFHYISRNFGYDRYPGVCHIIPNAAVMILSMLYGGGDFSRTQQICNMCGWDTDCNAGNVGAITGVLAGIEGIDPKWITPVNDLLISSSVLGGLNISTIPKGVELFCSLGYRILGEEPPKRWKEYFRTENYLLHFDLPRSTQAMRVSAGQPRVEPVIRNSREETGEGSGSLKITTDNLPVATEVKVYHKTYYTPSDLHDSRYDPSFTPILFPGQSVETSLLNRSGFPVRACIAVFDRNNNTEYRSEPLLLTGSWQTLSYRIPAMKDGLISEAAVILYRQADTMVNDKVLRVYMDYLKFSGSPDYSIDFSRERVEDYGFGHCAPHREISQFSRLNGLWELDGPVLSGSCSDGGEVYTGLYYGRDYSAECTVCPQIGSHHLLNFRVQGGARSYGFGFYGDGKIALLKKQKDYRVLAEKETAFSPGQEYRLRAEARGECFRLYLDGDLIFEYDDQDKPYLYGQTGFTVREGSRCHFSGLKISPV